MQTRKQDPDAIAEEAVGQRHGEPPPYAVKEKPDVSQEEMSRRLSQPAGPRASIPEKTAEAVGERVKKLLRSHLHALEFLQLDLRFVLLGEPCIDDVVAGSHFVARPRVDHHLLGGLVHGE